MKDMFRKFVFVGALSLGLIAFAEEEKTEEIKSTSEESSLIAKQPESMKVVCPVTQESGEDCKATDTTVTNAEDQQ